MTSASFAAFVTLPTVITAPGRYRTRGGEVVTITEASTKHNFGCVGTYSAPNEGVIDRWHKSGRLYFGQLSSNDVVDAIDIASPSNPS